MNNTKLTLDTPLDVINELTNKSLIGSLGIRFTKIEEGLVEATLQLSEKNTRPGGILHGGANLAMAETVAGLGSMLLIDTDEYNALGMQVSANHTGILKKGKAYAVAKIVHKGKQTHVWNIDISDEEGKLISTARVTNMIVKIDND